ncbi:protein PHOTOPERIOD-INDEPENDENT EARLY FLOWERING 1-like [Hordeum vulgare]|nr:protein PHOTOPERIOD-INDEPENDENT EARLY FLOWERING 1-like [Hordeum vulgare]
MVDNIVKLAVGCAINHALKEDDERTIDEDEAQVTEAERNEELAALQAEADIPIDDLLKLESSPANKDTCSNSILKNSTKDSSNQVNGCNHDSGYTSSDEGNFSEEVDDSHHYAEFVKRNHVQLFSLCLFLHMPMCVREPSGAGMKVRSLQSWAALNVEWIASQISFATECRIPELVDARSGFERKASKSREKVARRRGYSRGATDNNDSSDSRAGRKLHEGTYDDKQHGAK